MIGAGGITLDKRTMWLATEHSGVPAWGSNEVEGSGEANSQQKRETLCDVLKQDHAISIS
jgi:hypothetical protein